MPQDEQQFDPDMLSEMLPVYYKRLFPYGPFYRWLSYGNIDSRHFSNREFSFTLHDDIYIRYQSFNNQNELEETIKKRNPFKIDIGAVFSFPPASHRQLASGLVPIERELVFDIDLTDYDEIRTCCEKATVCVKCWKFMSLACKILDTALREDFGFNHILWVFSGRRGIHCWVCDASARSLSGMERSAVAEYLQLISGGADCMKKVNLPNSDKLHSSIRRALDIIEENFVDICIEDQQILDKPSAIQKFLQVIPDEALRSKIEKEMGKYQTGIERWAFVQRELKLKNDDYRRRKWTLEEIMLQYSYPRLDINVTKGLNHLLKAPFCIHPKTGKVCVPFNPRSADKFNPTKVPTINQLIEEVNQFDAEIKKQFESEEDAKIRVKDYKKTSMNKSIHVFEDFVRSLEDTWKGKNLKIAISGEVPYFLVRFCREDESKKDSMSLGLNIMQAIDNLTRFPRILNQMH